MSVYFFTARDCGMVKIGFSYSPWSRLSVAQSNCPVPLALAAILPGDLEDEAEFHRRFAADRVRGDWFHLSEAIEAFLAEQVAPTKPADGRTTRWARERERAAA